MGALFTAVSTSLPELVTAVSAVRHGALTLAVGGVIGGNGAPSILLTNVLLRREKHGFAGVGFESILVLLTPWRSSSGRDSANVGLVGSEVIDASRRG